MIWSLALRVSLIPLGQMTIGSNEHRSIAYDSHMEFLLTRLERETEDVLAN